MILHTPDRLLEKYRSPDEEVQYLCIEVSYILLKALKTLL
jgi:hypothetical protein